MELKTTFLFRTQGAGTKMALFNWFFGVLVGLYPMLINIWRHQYLKTFIDLFFVGIIFLPYVLEKIWKIVIFEELRLAITFQCLLHTVFGRVYGFYDKYVYYDDLMHVLGGGLLAAAGFTLVLSLYYNYFNRGDNFIHRFAAVTTLGLVNLIGVAWEIAEFVGDALCSGSPGYRLAQASLGDTMSDLIENNVGAVLVLAGFQILLAASRKKENLKHLFKNVIKIEDRWVPK